MNAFKTKQQIFNQISDDYQQYPSQNHVIDKIASPLNSASNKYGPVKAADNLWSIARQLIKDKKLLVHQGMIAIVNKNPRAFKRGNINGLLQGASLKLPTNEEIANITRNEAINQVRKHNIVWRQGGTIKIAANSNSISTNSNSNNDILLANSSQENFDIQSDSLPLELVVPTPRVALTKQVEALYVTKLDNRLLMVEEALDTLKRTNYDLSARQENLQEQNKTLTELLAIRETQILQLKNKILDSKVEKLEVSNKIFEQNVTESNDEMAETKLQLPEFANLNVKPIENINNSVNSSLNIEKDAPSASHLVLHRTQRAAVKAEPTKPKETKVKLSSVNTNNAEPILLSPVAMPQAVSPNSESFSWGYIIFLLGATFTITLGFLEWYRRRRVLQATVAQEGPQLDATSEQNFSSEPETSQTNVTLDSALDDSLDVADSKEFDIDDVVSAIQSDLSETRPLTQESIEINNDETPQASTLDQLQKADISIEDAEVYMAYERFEQAEKVLQQVISENPENWDAYLKLLQLFVKISDISKFNNIAKHLPSAIKVDSPQIWSSIQILKNQIIELEGEVIAQESTQISKVDIPLTKPSVVEPVVKVEAPLADNKIEVKNIPDLASMSVGESEAQEVGKFDLKKKYSFSLETQTNEEPSDVQNIDDESNVDKDIYLWQI